MNRLGCIIIMCIFCLNFDNIYGQNTQQIRKAGLEAYALGNFQKAAGLLAQADNMQHGDMPVMQALAISNYEVGKLDIAKQQLYALGEMRGADPIVFLYQAKCEHAALNFKEAIKGYKKYLSLAKSGAPERKSVIADIKRCAEGAKLMRLPEKALVENFGEMVNTVFDETMPIQSPNNPDKIYFSANRPDADGGLRNKMGEYDEKNGQFFKDIYAATLANGDWTEPIHLGNNLINTAQQEVLLGFAKEGQVLVFFRSINDFSGDILVDTFKADIELRTMPPVFECPIKGEIGDNSLFFVNDTLIIFASRREGGFGGSDLWYVTYNENGWTEPINLGKNVNTPFDETTPFLAKNGRTLYFSSNSLASMGGFDVFKSVFNDDSLAFQKPMNLGRGINSAADDLGFRLNEEGTKGFLASDRKEGKGGFDLYTALFTAAQNEQLTFVEPPIFTMVEAFRQSKPVVEKAKEIRTINYESIFYDIDEDILRGGNLKQLRNLAEVLRLSPDAKIIVTMHTSAGERTSFDLYFGVKRAEKIAKWFVENGVANERIYIKSVGALYPIAFPDINGVPNAIGIKLNKRIDFSVVNLDKSAINVNYDAPIVSPLLADKTGENINKHLNGLSYKIQVMASKRIFDSDILDKNTDAMLESVGTDAFYQYTVGLYSDFKSAEKKRQELIKEGVKDIFIVPYLNGERIMGDDAKKNAAKYPDLLLYLASLKGK